MSGDWNEMRSVGGAKTALNETQAHAHTYTCYSLFQAFAIIHSLRMEIE